MGVEFEGESEVADCSGAGSPAFGHGAEKGQVQDLGVRAPGRPLRRLRERARARLFARIEVDPGPAEERDELPETLLVGWWMDAVEERNPAPGKRGGRAATFAASMHSSMSWWETRRGAGSTWAHLAARPEDDTGLPDLEVESAPPPARLTQGRVDLPERLEAGHEPPEPAPHLRVAVEHRRLHLPYVSRARERMTASRKKALVTLPRRSTCISQARQRRSTSGLERAEPVREPLREHRNHPPGK